MHNTTISMKTSQIQSYIMAYCRGPNKADKLSMSVQLHVKKLCRNPASSRFAAVGLLTFMRVVSWPQFALKIENCSWTNFVRRTVIHRGLDWLCNDVGVISQNMEKTIHNFTPWGFPVWNNWWKLVSEKCVLSVMRTSELCPTMFKWTNKINYHKCCLWNVTFFMEHELRFPVLIVSVAKKYFVEH